MPLLTPVQNLVLWRLPCYSHATLPIVKHGSTYKPLLWPILPGGLNTRQPSTLSHSPQVFCFALALCLISIGQTFARANKCLGSTNSVHIDWKWVMRLQLYLRTIADHLCRSTLLIGNAGLWVRQCWRRFTPCNCKHRHIPGTSTTVRSNLD